MPARQKLIVEHAPEGVLLKPLPVFARTRHKDVLGCLAFSGAPKTVAEMRAGETALESHVRWLGISGGVTFGSSVGEKQKDR